MGWLWEACGKTVGGRLPCGREIPSPDSPSGGRTVGGSFTPDCPSCGRTVGGRFLLPIFPLVGELWEGDACSRLPLCGSEIALWEGDSFSRPPGGRTVGGRCLLPINCGTYREYNSLLQDKITARIASATRSYRITRDRQISGGREMPAPDNPLVEGTFLCGREIPSPDCPLWDVSRVQLAPTR